MSLEPISHQGQDGPQFPLQAVLWRVLPALLGLAGDWSLLGEKDDTLVFTQFSVAKDKLVG